MAEEPEGGLALGTPRAYARLRRASGSVGRCMLHTNRKAGTRKEAQTQNWIECEKVDSTSSFKRMQRNWGLAISARVACN